MPPDVHRCGLCDEEAILIATMTDQQGALILCQTCADAVVAILNAYNDCLNGLVSRLANRSVGQVPPHHLPTQGERVISLIASELDILTERHRESFRLRRETEQQSGR